MEITIMQPGDFPVTQVTCLFSVLCFPSAEEGGSQKESDFSGDFKE